MEVVVRWLVRILGFFSIIFFTGIIVFVTMQILSRFMPFSFIWTEELIRYCFLFAISCAAPIALLKNEYINVDLIIGRLTKKVRRFYELVIYIFILMLSLVMVKEGYNFMLLGRTQNSATMPFKMSIVHSSMLIMAIFLSFFCIVLILYLLKDKRNKYDVNGGNEL